MRFNTQIVTAIASALLASSVSADFTNSDWTTLYNTATISGGVTSHSSSFAIAVVPITTGSWTIKASTVAAQLEASSIAAAVGASGTVTSEAPVATSDSQDSEVSSADDDSDDDSYAKRDIVITTLVRRDDDDDDVSATASNGSTPTDISSDDDDDDDVSATASDYSVTASDDSTPTDIASDDDEDDVSVSSSDISPTSSDDSTATDTASSDDATQDNDDASSNDDPIQAVSCNINGSLSMTLANGILTDSHGRIGAIVSNRQFQFDGPPQAGTIYAKGWSITPEGNLAIGDTDIFYRCLSGGFYNLYDQNVAYQCDPIRLVATAFGENC